MVVCKFFQQGYCRFGQNCRFEHIYGSKYSYHANPPQQAAPTKPEECTDELLVNQVQSDMQLALRGGQWIISCYSPFKEKANFPGLSDLSPDEARLFIYEAKNSNNIEEAVTYMNNLFKESRQKYEQLLQPSVDVIKLLRSIYKGESVSYVSKSGQNMFSGINDAASSVFRKAVQSAPSVFAQGQQSIFNTHPNSAKELFSKANNTSIFGPSNAFGPSQDNSAAKSIFATAVQNSSNKFGRTTQPNPSSIFSAANQSIFGPNPNYQQLNQGQPTSVFNQNQNSSPFNQSQNISPFDQSKNTSPFNQFQNTSPFRQPSNSSPFNQTQNSFPFGPVQNTPFNQGNIFQTTESNSFIFSQANSGIATVVDNPGVYSKIEELSEDDLKAFQSERFELGFVPELPPPQQLCTRV